MNPQSITYDHKGGVFSQMPFYVFHRGPEGGIYQWEVARSDGAIVCGCTSEEAADEIVEALAHQACINDAMRLAGVAMSRWFDEAIIEQVGAA